jgi:hypothetical protein
MCAYLFLLSISLSLLSSLALSLSLSPLFFGERWAGSLEWVRDKVRSMDNGNCRCDGNHKLNHEEVGLVDGAIGSLHPYICLLRGECTKAESGALFRIRGGHKSQIERDWKGERHTTNTHTHTHTTNGQQKKCMHSLQRRRRRRRRAHTRTRLRVDMQRSMLMRASSLNQDTSAWSVYTSQGEQQRKHERCTPRVNDTFIHIGHNANTVACRWGSDKRTPTHTRLVSQHRQAGRRLHLATYKKGMVDRQQFSPAAEHSEEERCAHARGAGIDTRTIPLCELSLSSSLIQTFWFTHACAIVQIVPRFVFVVVVALVLEDAFSGDNFHPNQLPTENTPSKNVCI